MNDNEMDKPTRRAIAHEVLKQLGKGEMKIGNDVPRVGIYNSDSDTWEPIETADDRMAVLKQLVDLLMPPPTVEDLGDGRYRHTWILDNDTNK